MLNYIKLKLMVKPLKEEFLNQKNGFYRCVVKASYYTNLKPEIRILPLKNGKLFNPEYQHTYVFMKTRLSLIEDYYEIKKAVKSFFKYNKETIDLNKFKINKKDPS